MDRGRQIIRQWKLLGLLDASRFGATVKQLHDRIDEPCVERTIRRDLESLAAAGFPIVQEDGRWRTLRPGEGAWSIPVQPSMVIALLVSEELLEGSPLAQPLRDLRGRVEALLTPTTRAWCDQLRERFAVNHPPHVPVRSDVELAIDTAINDRRRLRIAYWSPSSAHTERVIDPLLLWHAMGGLYVVAWDDRSGEVRMFALQRIAAAEETGETFEPDESFDANAFVQNAFGVMAGPVHRIVVEFQPRVAHLFRERAWHRSQQLQELSDGRVQVTWTMAGLPEVSRWLAGFGCDVRVVSPVVLKEAVRAIHQGALDRTGPAVE